MGVGLEGVNRPLGLQRAHRSLSPTPFSCGALDVVGSVCCEQKPRKKLMGLHLLHYYLRSIYFSSVTLSRLTTSAQLSFVSRNGAAESRNSANDEKRVRSRAVAVRLSNGAAEVWSSLSRGGARESVGRRPCRVATGALASNARSSRSFVQVPAVSDL